MKELTLKEKLRQSHVTIGSWINIAHQSVIEVLATAGFEWLVLDMEHGAMNTETALNLIAHIQGNKMKALVRVSKLEEVIIKKVMDAGADGIIVPMIKTKKEAQQAVDYVKYPPVGKRGVGLSRAQKYGTTFKEYLKWVNEESIVIAQIEHIEAVQNLEQILEVKGIDGIIVGPYDLSASMGYPGQYHREDVKEALKKVEKLGKVSPKSLGFHVIESRADEVEKRIVQGYNFIAFSLDFFFLGDRAREEMELLRKTL